MSLEPGAILRRMRESLSTNLFDSLAVGKSLPGFDYELAGVEGVGKYIVDYSTLATFGNTGNLAVTYLGSHDVQVDVIDQHANGDFEVRIIAKNTSSLQSATRPPVIGYEDWYQDSVGAATDALSEFTGIGRTTSQTIIWTERIAKK